MIVIPSIIAMAGSVRTTNGNEAPRFKPKYRPKYKLRLGPFRENGRTISLGSPRPPCIGRTNRLPPQPAHPLRCYIVRRAACCLSAAGRDAPRARLADRIARLDEPPAREQRFDPNPERSGPRCRASTRWACRPMGQNLRVSGNRLSGKFLPPAGRSLSAADGRTEARQYCGPARGARRRPAARCCCTKPIKTPSP